MATPKLPKRIRIKPHSFIDGVRVVDGESRRLKPGLYILNKNVSPEEVATLTNGKFDHCVEILSDTPPQEELAIDVAAPQADPAFDYMKRRELAEAEKRLKAELEHTKK